MDNNINVTTHLADEDRALLVTLGQHLARLTDLLPRRQARAEARKTAPEAPKASTPTETPAEPEAPATVEPAQQETPTITADDIRQKAIALMQAGKKEEVRAVVTTYAAKIPDIPADKYGEVMDKLNALEG